MQNQRSIQNWYFIVIIRQFKFIIMASVLKSEIPFWWIQLDGSKLGANQR